LIKTIEFFSAHYKKDVDSLMEAGQYKRPTLIVLIPEGQFSAGKQKQTLRQT